QRASEGRLPAARLTHEPQHLTFSEVERDVVDGFDVTRLATEQSLAERSTYRVVGLQVPHGDEGRLFTLDDRSGVQLRLHVTLPRPPRSPRAEGPIARRRGCRPRAHGASSC